MSSIKVLGAMAIWLCWSNAYAGNAYCSAGNDLRNPVDVQVVGENIQRPRRQTKKDLRPLVRDACQEALNRCQAETHQRMSRAIERNVRNGNTNPRRVRRRLETLRSQPCYVKEASVIGRRGTVYEYRRMSGRTEFKKLQKDRTFAPGELVLLPGEKVETKAGTLIMQHDGNLVFYRASDGRPTWSSWDSPMNQRRRGYGIKGRYAAFQGDGNLVVYNWRGEAVFDTLTYDIGATSLMLQGDGNIVIRKGRRVLYSGWGDTTL